VNVTGFTRNELGSAQRRYLEAEKRIEENSAREAVLVSVDSLTALQRAYLNYFLDTRIFIILLQDALEGQPLEIDGPSKLILPSERTLAP
jgi:hypothetical protein